MKIIDWFKERSRVSQAAIVLFLATATAYSYGTVLAALGGVLLGNYLWEEYA